MREMIHTVLVPNGISRDFFCAFRAKAYAAKNPGSRIISL